MAKINFGGVVQDARGSQNGLVYSRNAGGAYVRRKVTPINPKSARQQQVRQSFGNNAKAWSGTLTASQRQAWTDFAKANPITNIFGLSVLLSGLATYQRLNQVLANIGSPPESTPPASLAVNAVAPIVSFQAAGGSLGVISITTQAQSAPNNNAYYIFATAPLAPGVTPQSSDYRYVEAAPPVASAVTLVFGAAYRAVFGAPPTGKQIGVLIATVNTATGAVLPGVKFSAITT